MNGHLRRPALSQAVRDYIKRYILENNLAPGDLLPSESQLAEDLTVGRSSVREAMKALQSLGIVDVRRAQGFVVRAWNFDSVLETLSYGIQFNKAAFVELLQIRVWLEAGTVSDVLAHITPHHVDQLRAIMVEWRGRFSTGEGFADLDERFHDVLYSVLDNETFSRLLHVFWRAFETVGARLGGEVSVEVEYRNHQAIFDALQSGDEARTRAALIASFHNLQTRLHTGD